MIGVTADGVAIELGGRRVVNDIDFTVSPGRVAAVVGPNGAGKSSLLRCLAGEIEPDEGSVGIGSVLDPHRLDAPARARVRSFLGQVDRPDVPFDVRTVIGFGAHLAAMDARAQRQLIDDLIEVLELGDVTTRRVSTLSGGERRRVSIARTLAQAAPVTILDEPTEHLDLAHAEVVGEICRRSADDGTTVVISTHDLNLASRFADHVLVLDSGMAAAQGTPSAVFSPEILSAVYRCEVRVMAHPDDGRPLIYR